MADTPTEVCGPDSSSVACRLRLHPVEKLCTTLKPPPFPGWLNQSEVEHYKRDCSSWRAYEDICIHGRGSLRFGLETPPTSPTTWIAPGIAFSASAILIVGTIIAYVWHTKYRSKYTVDKLQYHSYSNGHGLSNESGDRMEKVESYSVTIISTGKMRDVVESGHHETCLHSDDDVKADVIKEPDIMCEHDKFDVTSSPDLSLDDDYSGLFVLPNVVPYQDIITHRDLSPDSCRREPFSLAKSESSEPIQVGSRVYEVGYVNPAYDGNDSLKEGRSPKKKKKKPRNLFGDKKPIGRHRKY